MPNPDTSILIVDDAKFSTTVISRALKKGGYDNVMSVSSATDAFQMQKETPYRILIADWLMPEMDGLEMTRRIRQMDEASNRYTYIIMLTAKDGGDALQHAFDEGVDDFINKSAMQEQLLPRIYAAERMVDNQNRLLNENQRLIIANRNLKKYTSIDPLTGLGNRKYALNKLADMLKHSSTRGDVSCLILVNIVDWQGMRKKYSDNICNELIVGVSRRLRGLVRPMDITCRLDEARFALLAHQPDITQCTPSSYKRIHEGIGLRAFITSMGFITIKITTSIAAASNEFGLPNSERLIELAEQEMNRSENTGRIVVSYYRDMSY